MLFGKLYKQRAAELYEEHTAQEVFTILAKEYPNKQHPTERSLRRWSKARIDQLIRYEAEIANSISKEEHFEHLLEIVNLLLANEVGKVFGSPSMSDEPEVDDYTIISEESDFKKIPRSYLVERIENNIEDVCTTYNVYEFWDCFVLHLMAESTRYQDFNQLYNDHTIEFIDILRTLAQRKTFRGTCPVCKEWDDN